MKQLGWTSIKQSKKLIEAGLDPNTADMFYLYDWNNHKHNNTPDTLIICNWEDPYNKSIPCWSLGALIELLPKSIKIKCGCCKTCGHCKDKKEHSEYYLCPVLCIIMEGELFQIGYNCTDLFDRVDYVPYHPSFYTVKNSCLLDAVVEMIIKLSKEGHINKE